MVHESGRPARRARFLFGPFELDTDTHQLRRAGEPIALGRPAFRVLETMLSANGEIVDQAGLLAAGWGSAAVGETSLRQAITELRRALNTETGAQVQIATVRGEGYRIVTEVRRERALPAPTPARKPVGRTYELARLLSVLTDAVGGEGKTLLITGAPGIGKTYLAEVLLEHARAQSVLALCARASADSGAPPLWPFIRLLREHLADVDPKRRPKIEASAPRVAQLLHPHAPDERGLTALDTPERQRFMLLEELAEVYAAVFDRAPVLLVFDDLHAADELSQRFFVRLSQASPSLRIELVATCRPLSQRALRPLRRMLGALPAGVFEELALSGLSVSEVAHLCANDGLAAISADGVAEVHALTHGNPLFSLELARLLAHGRARLPAASDEDETLAVRAVVARRIGCLSKPAHRTLLLASVLGDEFALAELCGLSGDEPEPLVEALREACSAALLVEAAPGQRYRFAHPLLREAAYHQLEPSLRQRAHEGIASWLERRGPAVIATRIHELAHHYYCTANARVAGRAAQVLARAAERAFEATAFEEAATQLERALELLAWLPTPEPARELGLQLRLAEVRRVTGFTGERLQQMFLKVSEAASELGHAELFAQAALGYAGHTLSRFSLARMPNEADPVERQLLTRALALIGNDQPALRALLLSTLSFSLLYTRDVTLRHDAIEQACTIARAHADPVILARVLSVRVLVEAAPDRFREQRAACDELVSLTAAHGLQGAHVHALVLRAIAAFSHGDGSLSRRDFRHAVRVADELGCPEARHRARLYTFFVCLLEGRLNDVDPLISQLYQAEKDPIRARVLLMVRMLAVQYLRHGETGEPLMPDATIASAFPRSASLSCLLSLQYAARGDREGAMREFDLAAADDFAALPPSMTWMLELTTLGLTACTLSDPVRASRVARKLAPYGDQMVLYAWEGLPGGPVATILGMLVTTMGDLTEASRWFERAIVMCRRLEAPLYEQLTKSEYLRMLALRGTVEDLHEVRALAEELGAFGRRHGIGLFQARAAAAEARCAVRPDGRSSRQSESH